MLDLVIDSLQQPLRQLADRLGPMPKSALCDDLSVAVKNTDLMELPSSVNADKVSARFWHHVTPWQIELFSILDGVSSPSHRTCTGVLRHRLRMSVLRRVPHPGTSPSLVSKVTCLVQAALDGLPIKLSAAAVKLELKAR